MDLWRADVLYSKENFSKRTMRGYRLWGLPYVRLMRSYPIFAKIAQILATWFIEDIAYQMHCRPVGNWKGWILRELFFKPLCSTIGFLLKEKASSIIRNDKTTAWQ
ncbi:hypothetical protein CPter91_2984 [Collimonas pratensis]|uniref:Uncharacterized protein n=2 Tax=Collimonas pratensis TaxID=279113 RepID=A0A127Q689_9BURK|nr:hypothetical protein CPter91_2984 [Collimonas pratensis]